MFPSKAFLSLILVSLITVHANHLSRSTGKITLTLATRINQSGTLKLLERDQARAKFLQASSQQTNDGSPFEDANAVVGCTAQLGVGSPVHYYTVLVDTGSSNTFVGASTSNPYISTSTSKNTGNSVKVQYGTGFFSGVEWIDTATLSPELVIQSQSIGVANKSNIQYDGILGLGPTNLTANTVTDTDTVPTVLDNLLSQGNISQKVMGLYFVPMSEPNNNGTITIGGYDSSVITGQVTYVPMTTTSPASKYWGIEQSIHYGDPDTVILSTTAGIVDTGTTLILIARDAYVKYQTETASTYDPDTTLLTISPSAYSTLKTLSFNIGGTSYDLTPNAQIWPRSLNTFINGNSNSIYLIIGTLGTPSGSGLDFVIGYTFLERYYSVFDATNNQLGFASTAYTNADTN